MKIIINLKVPSFGIIIKICCETEFMNIIIDKYTFLHKKINHKHNYS